MTAVVWISPFAKTQNEKQAVIASKFLKKFACQSKKSSTNLNFQSKFNIQTKF